MENPNLPCSLSAAVSSCACWLDSTNVKSLPPPLPPSQLVRRNEELRLLYEKIKVQQSTLQRGQAAYRGRLNEIRAMKIKVGGVVMAGGGVWVDIWTRSGPLKSRWACWLARHHPRRVM